MSEAELTLDLNQTPYSINTRPDLLNTSEAGQRNEGIMKSSSNDLYYANSSVLHRTALVGWSFIYIQLQLLGTAGTKINVR